jgi:C_GCAxxG_C_C family probable redox protein
MLEEVCKKSGELFASGYCCSESVLMAVAEDKGIQSDLIPKIATGFCGGIAHTRNICGAVSGAIIALGMMLGRDKPEDPREELNAAIHKLLGEFEGKYGSSNCFELLDCDLETQEGMDKYLNNNLWDKCKEFTEEATRMTMTLLE